MKSLFSFLFNYFEIRLVAQADLELSTLLPQPSNGKGHHSVLRFFECT